MQAQLATAGIHIEPISVDPPKWDRRSILQQKWIELASFHWRYDPAVVQQMLLPGLQVDTFDGSAWVGLIPFEMRDVQLGGTPPVPWFGTFLEINVRTYVVDEHGRRAVWFFSLDVPRSAIVAVARTVFALPYCWAEASHERSGNTHVYRMRRRWPRSHANRSAEMTFSVGSKVLPSDVTELDHFLSARWALITRRGDDLLYGRVNHPRWPIHRVHDVEVNEDVIQAAGLPRPEGSPHAFFSPGVDVEVAWFDPIERADRWGEEQSR